jgi:hypothetical protein
MFEVAVSELDEAWVLALAKAEEKARANARADIAEYLALRSANDLMRRIGLDWLLTVFENVTQEQNRQHAAIEISSEDPYQFKVAGAGMVGRCLILRKGVRALFVEAGWPRVPRDGFIRGGGLACANIKHLGITSANEEWRLIVNPAGTPAWVVQRKDGPPAEIHEVDIRNHITLLSTTGESMKSS